MAFNDADDACVPQPNLSGGVSGSEVPVGSEESLLSYYKIAGLSVSPLFTIFTFSGYIPALAKEFTIVDILTVFVQATLKTLANDHVRNLKTVNGLPPLALESTKKANIKGLG